MESIHLLGGGYLNTVWPGNLPLVAAVARARSAFGVPAFATGQGFIPQSPESAEWLREQLAVFDFVEARDKPSAELLGVRLGVDDAFLAFTTDRSVYARADSPEVMILLQGDFVSDDSELEQNLVAATVEFVRRHSRAGTVGIVEGLPPDDGRFRESLQAEFPQARFYPFAEIWKSGLPARPGQTWITSRFHFHMLAALAGASGVALNLHPGYYGVKHGLLVELGLGWAVDDSGWRVGEITPANAPPANIRRLQRKLGKQKDSVARMLYPR